MLFCLSMAFSVLINGGMRDYSLSSLPCVFTEVALCKHKDMARIYPAILYIDAAFLSFSLYKRWWCNLIRLRVVHWRLYTGRGGEKAALPLLLMKVLHSKVRWRIFFVATSRLKNSHRLMRTVAAAFLLFVCLAYDDFFLAVVLILRQRIEVCTRVQSSWGNHDDQIGLVAFRHTCLCLVDHFG